MDNPYSYLDSHRDAVISLITSQQNAYQNENENFGSVKCRYLACKLLLEEILCFDGVDISVIDLLDWSYKALGHMGREKVQSMPLPRSPVHPYKRGVSRRHLWNPETSALWEKYGDKLEALKKGESTSIECDSEEEAKLLVSRMATFSFKLKWRERGEPTSYASQASENIVLIHRKRGTDGS